MYCYKDYPYTKIFKRYGEVLVHNEYLTTFEPYSLTENRSRSKPLLRPNPDVSKL